MNEGSSDHDFLERADAFIRLANEQAGDADASEVCSSLLYAAARFSAFIVFTSADSETQLAAARAEAAEHFGDVYRKMFEEHFEDHVRNFQGYRES